MASARSATAVTSEGRSSGRATKKYTPAPSTTSTAITAASTFVMRRWYGSGFAGPQRFVAGEEV